ncbi:MAG TPA: hypothetical protein VNA24_13450 [Hyalangium sp.]|nr:hypothetical protein [Hyalangium sp.]
MKINNRYGSVLPQLGTDQAAQPQQQAPVGGAAPTQAPNAVSAFSYGQNAAAAGSAGAPAAGGENPLQTNPLGVFSGALQASQDQVGLRPDINQLQTQMIAKILDTLLTTLQGLMQQLGGQLGGQPGAAGANAGAAGNAGNAGNAGAAGNAGNAGNAGAAGNAAGAAGNGGGAAAAGQCPSKGGQPGTQAPVGGGYGGQPGTQAPGGYGGQPGTQAPGTPGTPGTPGQPGVDAAKIDPNFRFQNLTTEQRNQTTGMNERERAALHLWGIQMGAAGKQDGGVLLNVLNNPGQFKPAEVALAKELAAKEQAQFGGITGKSLDQEFFGVYQKLTGKDISQRYGNSPVNFAQGPVNMDNRLNGANGLNNFENEVLQLWGHSPLVAGGKIDGSILEYSMNSQNAMEVNLNKSDLQKLLDADKASDGVVNGDSLENAMVDVLDRVYNGGPSASVDKTMNDALAEGQQRAQGLLPPSDRPAAQSLDQLAALHAGKKPGGGSCPFLQKGA